MIRIDFANDFIIHCDDAGLKTSAELEVQLTVLKQKHVGCVQREVWLEPISHDAELRNQLRGTYKIYDHWVENDSVIRFSLDTYGAKWLAFKPI